MIVGECGHVAGRRRARSNRRERFGEAEVQHLHGAVFADLDVRGLQIAVDDSLIVRRFERLGDLLRNRERLRERNRALCDPLGKRRAFNQLHDQRMDPVRVFESVDVCDVRMVERRQHLRFALETRESLRVGGEEVRQNLDGDVTVQPRVACPIDFAHSAGPEGGQDFVGAEASAGS